MGCSEGEQPCNSSSLLWTKHSKKYRTYTSSVHLNVWIVPNTDPVGQCDMTQRWTRRKCWVYIKTGLGIRNQEVFLLKHDQIYLLFKKKRSSSAGELNKGPSHYLSIYSVTHWKLKEHPTICTVKYCQPSSNQYWSLCVRFTFIEPKSPAVLSV